MTQLFLDGVELNPDTLWIDEYDHTPLAQNMGRSLSGALIIETAHKIAGRPITLAGDQNSGWATKAQVDALYAKLPVTDKLTLIMPNGQGFRVVFNHAASPIESKPIEHWRIMQDGDFYSLRLNLMTVDGYAVAQTTAALTWTINHKAGCVNRIVT